MSSVQSVKDEDVRDDEDGNKTFDNTVRRENTKLEAFCEYSRCNWKDEAHKRMYHEKFHQHFVHLLRGLLEWFDSKSPNDTFELLNIVLNGMSLLLLSQEMCGSKPELVNQYISLIHESFHLPESTKLLIELIEKYNFSNWPPEMLELRRMLEAQRNSPDLRDDMSMLEECESSDFESQWNSPDLRDDHTEYCAKSVEGDSLSSCNGSVSSGGNYSVAIIPCPYEKYGCREQLPRSEMKIHESKCLHMPTKCKYCKENVKDEKVHLMNCTMVPEICGNSCGEKVPWKDMDRTLCTHQIRECDFKEEGCQFMGYMSDLTKHHREQYGYHNQLIKQSVKKVQQLLETKVRSLTQQNSELKSELNQMHIGVSIKIQPVVEAVMKAESTIQHLQEGFSEMALMVQTLQATSYNGLFIWKIPEIQRRRHEAKVGKTVSLYSAPFYTGRYGYKACLRLYMDGDGGGKGTHLSFFLTIMRGEYDALLQWPFKHTVSLMLLDQDKAKNIVQSFRPEPTSSSFQRPRHEMNVASGCPMFAPLSILNNSSYVKDDMMFLKCTMDNPAINQTT